MDSYYMNKQVNDLYIKLEEVKETLDKSERLNTDEKIENLLGYELNQLKIENLLGHESTLNKNMGLLKNHKSNLDPNSKFYKTFNCLSIEYKNTQLRLNQIVNNLEDNNTRLRLNQIVNNLEEFDTSGSISDK